MPQVQNWKENALIAVSHQLPEIAKQLKIANELKALEIRLKFYGNILIEPIPEWIGKMEKILKGE